MVVGRTWLSRVREVLPVHFVSRACRRKRGRIAVTVRNDTPDPVQQLRVELLIEQDGVVALDLADVVRAPLPARPIPYGEDTPSRGIQLGPRLPRLEPYVAPPGMVGRGLKIDNSHSVHVTFDPLDLYAEDSAELGAFYLVASPSTRGRRCRRRGTRGPRTSAASSTARSSSRSNPTCRRRMSCSRTTGPRRTNRRR